MLFCPKELAIVTAHTTTKLFPKRERRVQQQIWSVGSDSLAGRRCLVFHPGWWAGRGYLAMQIHFLCAITCWTRPTKAETDWALGWLQGVRGLRRERDSPELQVCANGVHQSRPYFSKKPSSDLNSGWHVRNRSSHAGWTLFFSSRPVHPLSLSHSL